MSLNHFAVCLRVLALLGMAATAMAEESMPQFSAKDMVPLVHGPNWVDLDGDGHKDLAMKSRFNAPYPSPHSFSVYSFHLHTNEDIGIGNQGIHWHVASIPEHSPPTGNFEFTTHQGMTCTIRDIRLLIDHRKKLPDRVRIIEGQRVVSESYADASTGTFTVFALEKGSPKAANEFAFLEIARFDSKSPHCSISEAFEKELGLPDPDRKSSPEIQLR